MAAGGKRDSGAPGYHVGSTGFSECGLAWRAPQGGVCNPLLTHEAGGLAAREEESAGRYGFGVLVDSRIELLIAVDKNSVFPQRVNVLVSGRGFPKPLGKLGRSYV